MIIGPPYPQVAISNSNITFTCASLKVFPKHQVSWIFINSSGKEMKLIQTHAHDHGSDASKYSINRESETSRFGTLTIVNATFADQGTYRCNASNEMGYTEASANLTIQGMTMNWTTVNKIGQGWSGIHTEIFKYNIHSSQCFFAIIMV